MIGSEGGCCHSRIVCIAPQVLQRKERGKSTSCLHVQYERSYINRIGTAGIDYNDTNLFYTFLYSACQLKVNLWVAANIMVLLAKYALMLIIRFSLQPKLGLPSSNWTLYQGQTVSQRSVSQVSWPNCRVSEEMSPQIHYLRLTDWRGEGAGGREEKGPRVMTAGMAIDNAE